MSWISDNFPMEELECQYFEICNDYLPEDCKYNFPCWKRKILREHVEPYIAREGIERQLFEILEEGRRDIEEK